MKYNVNTNTVEEMVNEVVRLTNENRMIFCSFEINGRYFRECLDDIRHLTVYFEDLVKENPEYIKIGGIKVSFN